MTPRVLQACYCLPGSLEKVQNNGISLPPKRKESLQLCQRTSHICRQKGDAGDQHCDKWFNHQVRKAEEDPSRKRGQLLHPKRLHSSTVIERMDLGGSDIGTQQERMMNTGPELFSTTIRHHFYYLTNSINFIMRLVCGMITSILLKGKNLRKEEVKLCVWGHGCHQPGLKWATCVLLTLILVSVVSLITEVAGPSFLQLDLFFFLQKY